MPSVRAVTKVRHLVISLYHSSTNTLVVYNCSSTTDEALRALELAHISALRFHQIIPRFDANPQLLYHGFVSVSMLIHVTGPLLTVSEVFPSIEIIRIPHKGGLQHQRNSNPPNRHVTHRAEVKPRREERRLPSYS